MEKSFENGYTNFRVAILKAARPTLDQMQASYDEDFKDVFGNVLFDKEGPRRLNKSLSQEEQHFSRIWRGFVEIDNSFQVLGEIVIYIRRFPSNSSQISKTRYLHYHIANYLNEVYILKERLVSYGKVVTRAYRNDPRLKAMEQELTRLEKLPSILDSVIEARGSHVHVARYEDNDLDRLSLLELLTISAS